MSARLGGRKQFFALVAISVVLFAVLSMLAPSTYPTWRNVVSMAFQMSDLGILALAIALTFLIGGIDLSVVAVSNMAAITAAVTITRLEPTVGGLAAITVGIAAALVVGAVAGLINGMLVSRLRIHPIVITLGTLTLFTGLATGLTGGSTLFGTGGLSSLGRGVMLGIPIPFLIFVGLAVALSVLTTRTRWGFRAYAIGASEGVSRFGRISVARIQVGTYLISGLLASTAGILTFASTNAANVSFGQSQLLLAILIAVLAGVTPYGGRGRVLLVVLAVAAMQQLSTGINLALGQWSGAIFAAEFAWGVLLILVLGWERRTSAGGGLEVFGRWRRDQHGDEDPDRDAATVSDQGRDSDSTEMRSTDDELAGQATANAHDDPADSSSTKEKPQ